MLSTRRSLTAVSAAAALAAAAFAPAAADASSIVYVKDHNVFLTSPDAARSYQVTFDGTYEEASQADSGMILAQQRNGDVVRLDRSGRPLGAPVPGLGGAHSPILGDMPKVYGPYDPEVSPDGTRFAYHVNAYNPTSDPDHTYIDFTDAVVVESTDHFDVTEANWTTSVVQPSWLGNDRLLLHGSGVGSWNFQTWIPGGHNDSVQWWFNSSDAIENDPALSPDGTKLVSVAQTGGLLSASNVLHFFSVPGPAWTPPPYIDTYLDTAIHPDPATLRCQNVRDSDAHNPNWSPDSKAIAYDDKDGVWVQQVGDIATTCNGSTEQLVAPGGTHPDWGPADVDMAQKPSPAGPSAPAGPGTGSVAPPKPTAKAGRISGLHVAASAHRTAALKVRFTLDRRSVVKVAVCTTARHPRCAVTVAVTGRAGANTATVPARRLRRLRRGRYAIVVTPTGGAARTARTRLA